MSKPRKSYTVNVQGNRVPEAVRNGYHAYYSEYTNITAVEVKAKSKREAKMLAFRATGSEVLYVFE